MFFYQKFVIYYDTGKTEFVDDLYTYIRTFGGIREFHCRMKFNLGSFKKASSEFYGYTSWWDAKNISTNHVGFYLFTESGLMVSPDLLMAEYNKKYETWRDTWRQRNNNRWMPTKGNRHTTHRDKRPHNQQARRMAAGVVKEEGEPEFRGNRSHKVLGTYWDDISVRQSCSWKNCTKRKRQHKGS